MPPSWIAVAITSMRFSTPSAADRLRAEHAPVRHREEQLQVDRLRARVVAGVVARVEVDLLEVGDAGAPEPLLARAGRGDGQAEDADDRRRLHAAEARRAPGDRLGGDAALPVRRPGERHDRLLAGDDVAHLDRVADRPDVRIGGAHLRRRRRCRRAAPSASPASRARPVSGRTPIARMTRSAGSRAPLSVSDDERPVRRRPRSPRGRRRAAASRPSREVLARPGAAISGIERRHHLRQLLERRVTASPRWTQVLRHLEADEAAADDDGAPRCRSSIQRADAPRVGDGAHDEDAGQVDARQRRPDRRRARREHERVVALVALGAARELAHPDRAGGAVDARAPRSRCAPRSSKRSRNSSLEATRSLRSSAMTSPT